MRRIIPIWIDSVNDEAATNSRQLAEDHMNDHHSLLMRIHCWHDTSAEKSWKTAMKSNRLLAGGVG